MCWSRLVYSFEAFYSSHPSIKAPALIFSCAPVWATDPGWTCCSVQMWWRWRGGGGDNTRESVGQSVTGVATSCSGWLSIHTALQGCSQGGINALKKQGLMGEGWLGGWVLNCACVNSCTVFCFWFCIENFLKEQKGCLLRQRWSR